METETTAQKVGVAVSVLGILLVGVGAFLTLVAENPMGELVVLVGGGVSVAGATIVTRSRSQEEDDSEWKYS